MAPGRNDTQFNTSDMPLDKQVAVVQTMRQLGSTHAEIAQAIGKSLSWVYAREVEQYKPRGSRAEMAFQEGAVVPRLAIMGHTDIEQNVAIGKIGWTQYADITSTFDGQLWITEVKVVTKTGHGLQTAIGQLLLHRAALKEENRIEPRLQIALPHTEEIDEVMTQRLKKYCNIDTLLVRSS